MKASLFYTTCVDDFEANRISEVLLSKKLVVCAKRFPVTSSFLWKGKIEKEVGEVMLILESIEGNFEK